MSEKSRKDLPLSECEINQGSYCLKVGEEIECKNWTIRRVSDIGEDQFSLWRNNVCHGRWDDPGNYIHMEEENTDNPDDPAEFMRIVFKCKDGSLKEILM